MPLRPYAIALFFEEMDQYFAVSFTKRNSSNALYVPAANVPFFDHEKVESSTAFLQSCGAYLHQSMQQPAIAIYLPCIEYFICVPDPKFGAIGKAIYIDVNAAAFIAIRRAKGVYDGCVIHACF